MLAQSISRNSVRGMVEPAALVISDHYLVIWKSTKVLPVHPG